MTTEEKLEKIKKLADDMYYAAANLGANVGSGERLRKTMEDYHKFIIHEYNKEEPKNDWLQELHNKLDSLSKEDFEKVWAKYHQKEESVSEEIEVSYDAKINEAHRLGREEGILLAKTMFKEPVSEDFETALEKKVREAQDWTYIEEEGGECPLYEEFGADDLEEFARWGANWQKEQIIKRLCNLANIERMAEKFEDKYKPKKVFDTEYYKRGIFDTIKAIREG